MYAKKTKGILNHEILPRRHEWFLSICLGVISIPLALLMIVFVDNVNAVFLSLLAVMFLGYAQRDFGVKGAWRLDIALMAVFYPWLIFHCIMLISGKSLSHFQTLNGIFAGALILRGCAQFWSIIKITSEKKSGLTE